MSTIETINIPRSERREPFSWASFSSFMNKVAKARRDFRTRRHLADLTDAQMADVGLSRGDVEKEVSKSLFRFIYNV